MRTHTIRMKLFKNCIVLVKKTQVADKLCMKLFNYLDEKYLTWLGSVYTCLGRSRQRLTKFVHIFSRLQQVVFLYFKTYCSCVRGFISLSLVIFAQDDSLP